MLQAKSQRADDRSMKMRKLGKGDSDLTKKLDKETDKKEIHKQESLIELMMQNMTEWIRHADKLDKGEKV